MKTEKQVRTWWIDESDTHDGDIPIAFKEHPGQGPPQWQEQLIKVIAHEDHLAIVKGLEEKIKKLSEALKYYAHPEHYEERVTLSGVRKPGVLNESGDKARSTLEEVAQILSKENK